MSPDTLRRRLNGFDQISYFTAPTPLTALSRLSASLGGPRLWIKRDDNIGPGLGGNKGRKLSFLMADVLKTGRSRVVTFGGLQSNHARMTAAACAALGLQAHLFYFERRPARLAGNLLLADLFGARLHFVPFGGNSGAMTLERTNFLVRLLSGLLVRPRRYFMPVGGHNVLGALGYVAAALELHEQIMRLGLNKVTLVCAAGTGGTLAGLLAGFTLLDSPISLMGIDIGKLWRAFPASLARLAGDLCAALGDRRSFAPADIPLLVDDAYVGAGYAQLSAGAAGAIATLATMEGVLLDPVYTGKAFAGLIDLVQSGRYAPDETVIFLHSGGAPGLWAYGKQLSNMR